MKETSIEKYERLLAESKEVVKRMETLEEFLNSDDSFGEINVNQRGLLRLYLLSTEYYLEVLNQRISNAYYEHQKELVD